MEFGGVQRFEIVVFRFDMRALHHRKAKAYEEILHAALHGGHRVRPPQCLPAARQCDVQGFPLQGQLLLLGKQEGLYVVNLPFRFDTQGVDPLPQFLPLLRRQSPEGFENLRDFAFFAQKLNPQRFQ
jgi:hypothetical protein